ncbi:MAG: Maf family protein [Candidatus Methylomirabilia bacterium]
MSGPLLILASASPRREALLRELGLPFVVVPSQVREVVPAGPPVEAVITLARAKARAVASLVTEGRVSGLRPAAADSSAAELGSLDPVLVLGADTAVVLEERILGKPSGPEDARRMLLALSGRTHDVITGVVLVEARLGREASAARVTRVRMAGYSEAEIEAYLATGEPFDKAGAYAVQGHGSRLVAQVDGCYTNVVGLPLTTTRRLLAGWGVP